MISWEKWCLKWDVLDILWDNGFYDDIDEIYPPVVGQTLASWEMPEPWRSTEASPGLGVVRGSN